jgi:hypothetical protein
MCGLSKFNIKLLAIFCVILTLGFVQCTKPKVHYLRPIVLSSPDSRELFGCRINGRPFSPMASDSSLLGSCTYAPNYHGSSGFTFQVVGNRQQSSCEFSSVTITLDSIELKQDRTYQLGTPGPKKNYASYFVISGCALTGTTINTSDDLFGIVTITRLDPIKKIVNGEFDFRMRDADGNIVRVSDGIFDRHYTEQ